VQEIDVIRATRRFLLQQGLAGGRVLDLFTDAHPTLLGAPELGPFQRFTLAFDGFAVHPDLVARLADGESLLAVEAKGGADLLRGIAQAELYRRGFHLVLLACAGRPPQELLTLARQRAVGVLAVFPEQVELLDLPPAHLPQLRHAERIRRQLAANVALISAFSFNLPTHYLAMSPVLCSWEQEYGEAWAFLRALEPVARSHYPVLPKTFASLRSALQGAAKLGLVELQADRARLSFTGRAVADLLPSAPELANLHRQLVSDARGSTLAAVSPQAGAVLRLLLAADPVARLLIEALEAAGGPLSMRALVLLSAERDRALAPAVFFRPDAVATITGDDGQILWHKVHPGHFRSTTFFQYKSILKHAGIITAERLGGSSAKGYDPDRDRWELVTPAAGAAQNLER
jgi:hypothetical protein